MAEPESTDTLPSGQRRTLDLLDAYVDHIRDTVKLARPMKIAIDCGNGVGGAVAARLFRALGCEVDELYCQVDGSFPNHHPAPADPRSEEHTSELQSLMRTSYAVFSLKKKIADTHHTHTYDLVDHK